MLCFGVNAVPDKLEFMEGCSAYTKNYRQKEKLYGLVNAG